MVSLTHVSLPHFFHSLQVFLSIPITLQASTLWYSNWPLAPAAAGLPPPGHRGNSTEMKKTEDLEVDEADT